MHWKLYHSSSKMESNYGNKIPQLIAPKDPGIPGSSKSVMLAP